VISSNSYIPSLGGRFSKLGRGGSGIVIVGTVERGGVVGGESREGESREGEGGPGAGESGDSGDSGTVGREVDLRSLEEEEAMGMSCVEDEKRKRGR
jgi:hypothetical protein